MFLKNLKIENSGTLIRNVSFHKGINLIVDETNELNKIESGNNVGKTTVIRLIDFCLGGKGENIYKDPEFKNKGNTEIESFLKENNIIVTLVLCEDIDNSNSKEITIKKNFLLRKEKIQEINGYSYNNLEFPKELKKLIFNSTQEKPTFRQIIAKNIRDEKSRLTNTLKILHPTTTRQEYEALYLFWLGVDLDVSSIKQNLLNKKKLEENLLSRLNKNSSLSQIEQSLLIINRSIEDLESKKNSFNLNQNYSIEIDKLNEVKSELNMASTNLSRLEIRKDLIIESRNELEKDVSDVNVVRQIEELYREANLLIPNLQVTFEETLKFHNEMVVEKIKFITEELPALENKINDLKRNITALLNEERISTDKLQKSNVIIDLQQLILKLNQSYESKGHLEESKRLIINSQTEVNKINGDLDIINSGIDSKNSLIQARTAIFNRFFSELSYKLYGEQFVLSSDKNDMGYELNISTISGNLGTGKKKGQMAAFDLAYIQFADFEDMPCLHFILQDQIENVHDNQISNLLTSIVSEINCQYILPVLRDKLPKDIDVSQYEVLSLSQNDKLFKLS